MENATGTDVFMYNYCNSTFWDGSLLQQDYPSFTECFVNIVFVWGPCGLLLLAAPFYLFSLSNTKDKAIKWSWLHTFKIISILGMLASTLVQLFYRVYQYSANNESYTIAEFVSPSVIAGTLIVAFALQEYCRVRGVASSAILFLFWFILLLCGIPMFTELARSAIDDNVEDIVEFIIFYVYWGFLFLMFILNMFAEYKEQPDNANPESYSSFFSQVFYWWLNPLLYLGYKRPLTIEDMWNLNEKDKSVNCAKMLDENWAKQLRKNYPSLYEASYNTNGTSSNGYTNKGFSENQTKTSNQENPDDDDIGYQIHDRNSKYQPSLVKALVLQFWKPTLLAMVLKLGNDVIQFFSPQILSLLIDFVGDPSVPMWQGYFYAAAMYIVAVIKSLFLQYYFYICYIIGMNMRTTLNAIIYKKALVLSNAARGKSTVGEIVNLMMVDTQRLMDLMAYINILWSGPLQIILALVFLWDVLGVAVLAGFGVMILVIPVNLVVVKRLRALSAENMKLKDKRVKLTTEVLNGAKVIKLYAWEPSFIKQVTDIRTQELALARKLAVIKALVYFLFNCTPFVVSIVSFAVYLSLDDQNVLDSTTAFVSLSLFNILRFPLIVLPNVISSTVQASVSIKRLSKYLLSSELNPDAVNKEHNEESQIQVKDGTFSWDGKETCLENINMQVNPKELVAVVGHVGCGKSSLMAALLGEMEKEKGYVGMRGSVAYVPQQAWIQNATVKENILFGKSIDESSWEETSFSKKKMGKVTEEFYQETIRATALESDLRILTAGDQTEIGEKGVNLSGGQKQRVSLARAVFSDADVYLLDDPLSAVDSHVGAHIFDNVISDEGLLGDKTRILVTHSVAYLERCHKIIVMVNGKVTEVGSYQELVDNGEAFSKFLEEFGTKQEDVTEEEISTKKMSVADDDGDNVSLSVSTDNFIDAEEQDEEPIEAALKRDHRESVRSRLSRSSTRKSSRKLKKVDMEKDEKEPVEGDGKLVEKEATKEGNVSIGVFTAYMKAIGYLMVAVILSAEALYQGATIGTSIFLSDWSDDADKLNVSESRDQNAYRLGVYGALGFAQAALIMAETYIMAIGSIHAARTLHYDMLVRILRAPMSFFDTTPIGRIINRFAKDIYTIDDTLPWSIRMMNNCFLSVIGTIAVIMSATPIFGAVIVPIFALYGLSQRFYVRTSRQLKRIESVTRSPIYSQFQETLSGVSTIRAFGHEKRFREQSDKKVDINQGCYFPNIVSNRWLAVQLDVVGNAIVFFAALFAVLGRDTNVDAAEAALSVSYALQITSTLNWMVRQISEVETQIVSVERVKEYSELEMEADWDAAPGNKPEYSWPAKGNVAFNRYSTRYREGLDLVVKEISCCIYPGEKAGIVGRTGAGKSSLTLALFRLIEPANGSIIIDGVDISKIGLHDLRQKVTIIPQDPVLFSGTLRSNLDPFESYTDDQIWDSLKHSHLYEYVSGLPEKLEHICAEGGENLSVGQRQLVCLARALLRKSMILVLDEATAAVDLQTDELIQSTIREQFSESTILTIAHRLNTIMDYDKILVLHEGKLMEVDSPSELLKNKKSAFYGMAKDAGLI